jgi:hypothetical protein
MFHFGGLASLCCDVDEARAISAWTQLRDGFLSCLSAFSSCLDTQAATAQRQVAAAAADAAAENSAAGNPTGRTTALPKQATVTTSERQRQAASSPARSGGVRAKTDTRCAGGRTCSLVLRTCLASLAMNGTVWTTPRRKSSTACYCSSIGS